MRGEGRKVEDWNLKVWERQTARLTRENYIRGQSTGQSPSILYLSFMDYLQSTPFSTDTHTSPLCVCGKFSVILISLGLGHGKLVRDLSLCVFSYRQYGDHIRRMCPLLSLSLSRSNRVSSSLPSEPPLAKVDPIVGMMCFTKANKS